MSEQLTNILQGCLNPDNNVRMQAQRNLEQAKNQNLAVYLATLVLILADESKPRDARQLAGLELKNALQGRSEERSMLLAKQWRSLDPNLQERIRGKVYQTLNSEAYPVRKVAARVLASIASIDLYDNKWLNIVPTLSKNVTGGQSLQLIESSLLALGYLCEICHAPALNQQTNDLLTAVFHGMRNNKNMPIKLAGVDAFFHCLELARGNFQNQEHRNFIFQILCQCAVCGDAKVRKSSLESIIKIAILFYGVIGFYLNDLTKITLELASRDPNVEVALQGIEFWSTLAEVETEILEELEDCRELQKQPTKEYHAFVKNKLPQLCPVLQQSLLKQPEDLDTWGVSAAAGTCISLVSHLVADDIIPHIMPFVVQNLNSQDWHQREAATLSFSAIVDGPSKEGMTDLVNKAIPQLLNHVKDPVLLVQDTTIFCIGRIAKFQPKALITGFLEPVLNALMFSMTLRPVVAEKACWALTNITKQFQSEVDDIPTSPLSKFFQRLAECLLGVTQRNDIDSLNFGLNAYEALSGLISVATPDCYKYLEQRVVGPLVKRLINYVQGMNEKNRHDFEMIQGLICGSLANCTEKLGENMSKYGDDLMKAYLSILKSNSAPVQHEVFMAIGGLATALGEAFTRYMQAFSPFLLKGLHSQKEEDVCISSIYCVVDICYAIKKRFSPFADNIVRTMLMNLKSNEISRDIKPLIIASFGDIAFGIGADFRKYVIHVASVLKNAGKASVNSDDEEMVDYLNTLREHVFDAYSGILQGVKKEDPTIFDPFVKNLIEFIKIVFDDQNTDGEVVIKACTAVGDLINVYGKKCKEYITFPFIRNLIEECSRSSKKEQKKAADYTKSQIRANFDS